MTGTNNTKTVSTQSMTSNNSRLAIFTSGSLTLGWVYNDLEGNKSQSTSVCVQRARIVGNKASTIYAL